MANKTVLRVAIFASFVPIYGLTLYLHGLPADVRGRVGIAILAAGNLFFYDIGVRLLVGLVLWWLALPRVFMGHLTNAVLLTLRSQLRSRNSHVSRFGLNWSFILLLVLGWIGHRFGLHWVVGSLVALLAFFVSNLDAFLRPPVILFLGPSDEQSVSLLKHLQDRFPIWRIATMVGPDKRMSKRIASSLVHGDFRHRRSTDDLAWLDSLDALIEVARVFVLDARIRKHTEKTIGQLIESAPVLFEAVQHAIGVEGPVSVAAILRARPELLEEPWVSPEMQLEVRRLLLKLNNDRSARTVVVVDSDETTPLLDKLFRDGGQLYRLPAHRVTVEGLATAVMSVL